MNTGKRVLVTGFSGYIGTVMTRVLKEQGYGVTGLDCLYYDGCEFFQPEFQPDLKIIKDIRDVNAADLEGIWAVIHLAALSNDPLGEINPRLTGAINHEASIRLMTLARQSGVERFLFASSCSLYGIAPDDRPLSETAPLNPITSYAESKVHVERDGGALADDDFHPVFMRNSTVYGVSPRLRLDLVVNNLTAWGHITGEIAIMSDGTPWRPLIHVEDFCRAFAAALEAPSDSIHNQAFNVGLPGENYQVRDIAALVEEIIPGCRVQILNKTGPDERTYKVDFSKIQRRLPNFKPRWNLRRGIEELYRAYQEVGLTREDFESSTFFRVRWLQRLIESGDLDHELRWKRPHHA